MPILEHVRQHLTPKPDRAGVGRGPPTDDIKDVFIPFKQGVLSWMVPTTPREWNRGVAGN